MADSEAETEAETEVDSGAATGGAPDVIVGAALLKCARCHDPDLNVAGALSSVACARCGGGFIPEDGTSRLLDELGHTTAELRELAALFGGARLQCPGCKSKMSPLQLRGVTLDVCFGCGGLWVDKGDLEAVSSTRYQMPAPTQPLAKATMAIVPAQGLVRVDERTLPRHITRAVLAGVGAVGVVWTIVGILPIASGAAGIAALAGAFGLSRRHAFDVLPRARRMMRWRGYFAPTPKETEGEAFSPDSCVVVRQVRMQPFEMMRRRLPWVVLDLVDAEGRDLVRLHGPMVPQRAWTEAPRYARALGVTVRFDVSPASDDALDVSEQQRAGNPGFGGHDVVKLSSERGTAGMRRIALKAYDNTPLGAALTEVPSKFRATDLDGLLAEHFVLEDAATGQRARLYSTHQLGKRTTIVVGPDGAVLGHVEAHRNFLADTFTWKGPQARRQLNARVAHGAHSAVLVDGHGRDVGALEVSTAAEGDPRPVTLHVSRGRATGIARWGALALALHVSLAAAVDDL
jgi:hypothetical protein